MTKKERYTLHQNGNNHTVIDEEKNVPLIMIEFKENEFPVYACFHRIIDLLNEKDERIKELEKENKFLRCTIESNSQDDYIDYLEKQSKRLEARITKLEKKEQDKEKDNVMWALNQFKYKEKTEDERKAFSIIESILNTKW